MSADLGYRYTINWAYKQVPEEHQHHADEWVTDYLWALKHFAAVEAHLDLLVRNKARKYLCETAT